MSDGFGPKDRLKHLQLSTHTLDVQVEAIIGAAAADIRTRGLSGVGFHPAIAAALNLAEKILDHAQSFDSDAATYELGELALGGPCNNPYDAAAEQVLKDFVRQWVIATAAGIGTSPLGRRVWTAFDSDEQHRNDLIRTVSERCNKLIAVKYGQLRAQFEQQRRALTAQRATDLAASTQPRNTRGTGGKGKRSTQSGDAREKLIAALTMHHKFANGSSLKTEPIGCNELAALAVVSRSTASTFFNTVFNERKKFGHRAYQVICREPGRLVTYLAAINDVYARQQLFGRLPPGERQHDDED